MEGVAVSSKPGVALAETTDGAARRHFSAPNLELWVGTLKQLLNATGIFALT